MPRERAVQLADRLYWVGTRLPDDRFQCHAYLIENGSDSVLVDPGSPLTIRDTLRSVQEIVPVSDVRWLVCHHADPDIAACLPYLSDVITRADARVVTEWRAAALLRHYAHRYDYYLVEENAWAIELGADRRLEFQLTPYLHFPGAMVSFDTATATLFSSDLFGGFVPDNSRLVSDDVAYIIDNARPFHQHYMPSRELLDAGLTRIQHRWPRIARIAPQHGHVIDGPAVADSFTALKAVECGVFALADADLDLQRLLRIAQARAQITDALLTATEPPSLVSALNRILHATHATRECALFIDLPDQGWTMWANGGARPVLAAPPPSWPAIALPGDPAAVLAIHTPDDGHPDPDLVEMLQSLASAVRPAVDQYLHERRQSRRVADFRRAALTDPLTGLGNRRALASAVPTGTYALIAMDLDHFKQVNDEHGHGAGDAVLAHVAAALSGAVRGDDRVYRVGGEEFLVVLPDADERTAVRVAERIAAAVRAIDLRDHAPDGRVTVSLGVTACVAANTAAFEQAVAVADQALYAAKDAGRDRVRVQAMPLPAR